MLFLLSIAAFLQMMFIPGFVALRYSRITLESKLQTLVYAFGLSLLINYLLVYLLTLLHLYRPTVIYAVLLIEIILLAYYWKTRSQFTGIAVDFNALASSWKTLFQSHSFLYNAALVLSLAVIALFVSVLLLRLKAVFYLNDPVLGWNRFALDWFQNRLPVNTWFYPQLIPANWSLAYVIMRTPDIQMTARNLMPLFSIFTLLLFFDLGWRKKRAVYFLGSLFYGLILLYLFNPVFIAGGHMEIPVAFFAFLSFYVLHLHHEDQPFQLKYTVLSVIFASAAAVTKQPGIYILIFILAWNARLIYRHRSSFTQKTLSKTAGVILLIIAMVVLSWYLYRFLLIQKGIEKSGIHAVTQEVHQNRTYLERMEFGINRLVHAKDKKDGDALYVAMAFFLMLLSLFRKNTRVLMLAVVVPYTLLWSLFFSYDQRNLAMVLPFMAFCAAVGVQWLSGTLATLSTRLPAFRLTWRHLAAIILPLLAVLNFTLFKSDSLRTNQLTQLKRIGDVELNLKLYDYYNKNGLQGKIFSKYPYLRFLPILKNYWAENRSDPGVRYYLETFLRPDRQWVREIKQKIKSGEYRVLFAHGPYRFLELNGDPGVR
jgi:hypothetical protein